MSVALPRHIAPGLALALACLSVGSAYGLTVSELQGLLKSEPAQAVSFDEVRESPWLAAPVESHGTMRSSPEWLEKRVAAPQQETWRLLSDRVEWVGPGGVEKRQILYSQAPALAALAVALRQAVAGELLSLEQDFRIEVRGDTHLWTVLLQPRRAEIARHIDHLELEGTGAHLRVFIVVESQGERTTTHLQR